MFDCRVPKSQISLDKTQITKLKTYLKAANVGFVSLLTSDSTLSDHPQTPRVDDGLVGQELPTIKPIPSPNVLADTPVVDSSVKTPVAARKLYQLKLHMIVNYTLLFGILEVLLV